MTEQWKKDKENFEKNMPLRFLTLTSAIIGLIHFANSGWKADWYLVAFVVLCFTPWLGRVIKSINLKDGAVDFQDAKEGSEVIPENHNVALANAQAAVANEIQINGVQFHYQEMKVIATLWKFQKIHSPNNRNNRWTFTVGLGSPEYIKFSIGFINLLRKGYTDAAPNNGQIMLTDAGYDFCVANNERISSWRDIYDKFSN